MTERTSEDEKHEWVAFGLMAHGSASRSARALLSARSIPPPGQPASLPSS